MTLTLNWESSCLHFHGHVLPYLAPSFPIICLPPSILKLSSFPAISKKTYTDKNRWLLRSLASSYIHTAPCSARGSMSLLRGRCHVRQEEGCGAGPVPQESYLLVSGTKDAGPLRIPTLSAGTWMTQTLGSSSRTNQTLKLLVEPLGGSKQDFRTGQW